MGSERRGIYQRYRSSIVAVGIALSLAGCLNGNGPTIGAGLSDSPIFSKDRATPSKDLVRTTSVMGGAVSIAAPRGFCIDTTAKQDTNSGAFVPIGACAALTKNHKDPKPDKPAFLTASVLPMPPQAAALPDNPEARISEARAFIESDLGKSALSRAGKAETITLLDMSSSGDVLFVHVRDTSGGLPAVLSDKTRRAFFARNGMLVTASVTAFDDQKLAGGEDQKLLSAFVKSIQKANPNGGSGNGGLKGLLERLRN